MAFAQTYRLFIETATRRGTDVRTISGTLDECDRLFQTLLSHVGVRTPIRTFGYPDTRILKSICIRCDGVVIKSATYIGRGDKRYKRCELVNPDGTRVEFINDTETGAIEYLTDERVRARVDYRENLARWRRERHEAEQRDRETREEEERARRAHEEQAARDYQVALAEWRRTIEANQQLQPP